MRHVTPKPTSSTFVKAKARMALVTFWICRSLFFFFSPLQRHSTHWRRVKGSPQGRPQESQLADNSRLRDHPH